MRSIVLTLFFVISTLFLISQPISASGDQVRVSNEDGVMYLTTEVDGDGQTIVATEDGTEKRTMYRIAETNISVPTGFATSIGNLLNAVIRFVMLIAALLVLFYLIWGGLQWITSGGDKGKIDAARQKLMAAVIGLIVLASSYAILLLALQFLGFSDLDDVFSNVRTLDGGTRQEETNDATPSAETDQTKDDADNLGELL